MEVTYTATGYQKDRVIKRYIQQHPIRRGLYKWCETNREGWDIRQGTAEVADVPANIREICDKDTSVHYACEWPFEEPAPPPASKEFLEAVARGKRKRKHTPMPSEFYL